MTKSFHTCWHQFLEKKKQAHLNPESTRSFQTTQSSRPPLRMTLKIPKGLDWSKPYASPPRDEDHGLSNDGTVATNDEFQPPSPKKYPIVEPLSPTFLYEDYVATIDDFKPPSPKKRHPLVEPQQITSKDSPTTKYEECTKFESGVTVESDVELEIDWFVSQFGSPDSTKPKSKNPKSTKPKSQTKKSKRSKENMFEMPDIDLSVPFPFLSRSQPVDRIVPQPRPRVETVTLGLIASTPSTSLTNAPQSASPAPGKNIR
jgi:hypothetical protein